MKIPSVQYYENNFDLIRLFAAFQVATLHIFGHFGFASSAFLDLLAALPGVPIFFFVSGYLVPRSLEKIQENHGPLRLYFLNRFLRLYPALWICFTLCIASVYLSGYLAQKEVSFVQFGVWTMAQNTFVQFYNPDFMRDYGSGVLNGSLWTISVELQFYLLTPLIVFFCQKSTKKIALLCAFFCIFNIINNLEVLPQSMLFKLFGVSFLPWIYMFLLGYLFATSDKLQRTIQSLPLATIFATYVAVYLITHGTSSVNNNINPLALLVLCCLVARVAYSKPTLSRSLFGKNDMSYGIYIYHMPIVNGFIFAKLTWPSSGQIALIYLLVVAAATVSWFIIERPALRLKRQSMRTVTS